MFESKLEAFMGKYFMPFAQKFGEQKHLKAVRDGIILSLPLLIAGSFFLVVGHLPIPGYQEFMGGIFGADWLSKFSAPVGVTFNLVAIFGVIGIAYNLARENNALMAADGMQVDPLSASVIALTVFLLVTPSSVAISETQSVSAFASSYLGGQGLFVAIICALVSTEMYTWFIKKKIVLKLPDVCPPMVAKAFVALLPSLAIISLFLLVKTLIENTSYNNIHKLIVTFISDPLTGFSATLAGGLIYVFINSLFWSFGIHGGSIAGTAFDPMFSVNRDANVLAFQAGEAIPHIINKEFFSTYVFFGGSGATLCLVLGFLFISKAKQFKEIGKLSIGSSIFNINEPVIFGAPIVLNPILIIPFILTPMILTVVSYVAVSSGLVAPAFLPVSWTMPVIASGILATGGQVSGIVLQIVNVIIGCICYYPFLMMLDKNELDAESLKEQNK